jgi:hypothetical protein
MLEATSIHRCRGPDIFETLSRISITRNQTRRVLRVVVRPVQPDHYSGMSVSRHPRNAVQNLDHTQGAPCADGPLFWHVGVPTSSEPSHGFADQYYRYFLVESHIYSSDPDMNLY